MPQFAMKTSLPAYLRKEQDRIESTARDAGLDFFPIVYEMLTYDQMNEVASFGGFPQRYPHWRFGMEYEQLSKSYEYGASKIYEMVINNNPSFAYLLEGNSLVDQKMVMCHVSGHVDFFKNNFVFRATDLDGRGRVVQPSRAAGTYDPNRKWIDKMANHGARISRHIGRHGIEKVETFIDACLSLENLIDPYDPFKARAPIAEEEPEDRPQEEVPRLRSKGYMESFINPDDYIAEQRKKLDAKRDAPKKHPESPERDVLEIIREEAYYFVPQMQTKIMNEGWASYWHSKLMTGKIGSADEILDYADRNAGVMATSAGRLNPYKLGVELYRDIEERWNLGRFGKDWEECDDQQAKQHWDLRLGLGFKKILQVRALYNDVTFLDEFLTPEFCRKHKMFSFSYNGRNERYEIESREFKQVKEKILFQLTNFGNPFIFVEDANFDNRGELLLRHDHQGVDLRIDYAREVLAAMVRVWKRPVNVVTKQEEKPVMLRFDGTEQTSKPMK